MSRQTPPIKRKTSINRYYVFNKKEELKNFIIYNMKIILLNSYINFMISSLEFSYRKEDNENLSQKKQGIIMKKEIKLNLVTFA